jgi:Ca2+-binding RTX toxin-like protein
MTEVHSMNPTTNEIIFIDGGLEDIEVLKSGLSPEATYFVLDPGKDGLGQMANILSGYSDLSAIHILSHGEEGSLRLGSTVLDQSSLAAYSLQLSTIGGALSATGDLLLYGCNVAQGVTGQAFIQELATITGADVAASTDLTGSTLLGGDWLLEISAGAIEAGPILTDNVQQDYNHMLNYSDDYDLAVMSLLAYYDHPSNPLDSEGNVDVTALNAWHVLENEGWSKFEAVTNGNFAAISFKKGDRIVIAYRGTDSPSGDFDADTAIGLIAPAWDSQFDDALTFAENIRVENPDCQISVTGHSLGGALAQVAAKMFHFEGAAFDPGGAANIADTIRYKAWALHLIEEHPDLTLTIDQEPLADFTNYTVAGSIVSGWSGDMIGTNTEQLDFFDYAANEKLAIAITTEIASYGMGGFGFLADTIREVMSVFSLHRMDGILELMSIQKSNEISATLYQRIHDTVQQAVTTGDYGFTCSMYDQSQIEFSSSSYNNYIYANDNDNTIYGNAGDDIIYSLAGNDIVYAGDGHNTINTAQGNDEIHSGGGNDKVYAGSGNDIIDTGVGNDFIDGGTGNDTMIGGLGNDTYYIDSANDSTTETSSLSNVNVFDTVCSKVSWTLGANIEHMELANGSGSINGTGNELNNIISGNDSDNILNGKDGNDILNGELGDDTMIGGSGNDIYYIDSASDVTIETSTLINEHDIIHSKVSWTLGDNIEELDLVNGSGSINGTGNELNNIISGNDSDNILKGGDGNDNLYGGLGDDTMIGGLGNDWYAVNSTGDIVIETSTLLNERNTVLVVSDLSWTLGANIENLIFLDGIGAFNETGNELNNFLTGSSAANILDGGIGDDVMRGSKGDDTYHVDSTYDIVIENLNEGTDTVISTATYILTPNIENFTLTGSADINGIGNDLANILTGNVAGNVLNGMGGSDTMKGGAGDDTYIVDNSGDVVVENSDEGSDTVLSSTTYTLGANVENLTLTGSLAINGTGNELNNILTGNSAANILDGGAGDDAMAGGLGSDTYYIDSAGDVVMEYLNEGTDTLQSSISYTLGADVEKLILTGSNDLNGTGNTLANTLIGNIGVNILDGGNGNDTMQGGQGDDTYFVDAAGDIVIESVNQGVDTVISTISATLGANIENLSLSGSTAISGTGNTLANTLIGNSANNILDGLAGNDTMTGGLGDDIYYVDASGDVVTEQTGEGTDTVRSSISFTLGANVEKLFLTGSAAINGTGNELNNTLAGNSAANILDGGEGVDTMSGGLGNDTYVLDNVGDVIVESFGAGTDTVQSSFSYTLGANFENLTLTGSLAINGTSNTLNNTLIGNSGANTLDGNTGNDTMTGGLGDDIYYVDSTGDTVSENADAGIDSVFSSVAYSLAANVENLTLTGVTTINGTGNGLANTLLGNSAANILSGLAGNDTLDGKAGKDTMLGGLGNDTYVVDNTGDVVTESSTVATEIDTVESSISCILGSNVENLLLTGSGNITGTGNTSNNTLTGNDGNNILDGKTGLDTMIGGKGNDTYLLDKEGELTCITEIEGGGIDLLKIGYANSSTTAAKSISLADNLIQVEQVTLLGTGLFNITGNDLDNVLTGNASINELEGGKGNDTLDGKGGKDILRGGSGEDTYVVDAIGDQVIETMSEGEDTGGTDTVRSAVTWTLGDFVENLTLTGTAAINGTGNSLTNVLTGNTAANCLDGGLGADTLVGGLGNDTYVVDDAGDTINETSLLATEIDTVLAGVSWTLGNHLENLTLTGGGNISGTGNALRNTLIGNTGANRLDGGLGADKLLGGLGNDTYVVDNTGDVVTETTTLLAEIDTVESGISYTLGSNVENLLLTGSGNITGTGNTSNNMLTGNDGNNILDGKTGLDTMIGGKGNDTYLLDKEGELTCITEIEGGGIDLLKIGYANSSTTAAKSISLANNLIQVEQVTLLGTGLFNITGNDLDNVLTGNASINELEGGKGNDTLDGKGGKDILRGGSGNDTYIVDNVGDQVIETASEDGTDTVRSAVTRTLGDYVENLTLTGTSAINGTGNGLANVLTGNTGANRLDGGLEADTLVGGKGNDTLTGGGGADFFLFDTVLSATTNKDSITDFLSVDDTIILDNSIFTKLTTGGTLSADNFHSSATGKAADDNDYILYNTTTGGLFYDADGNKAGVAIQFATLTSKPQTLMAADFTVLT